MGKDAFILNYDENDGIFDHVAPPVPPAGTPHEFVNGVAIGGGFGFLYSHFPVDDGGKGLKRTFGSHFCASIAGAIYGVREPNISDWRRNLWGPDSPFELGHVNITAPPPRCPVHLHPVYVRRNCAFAQTGPS